MILEILDKDVFKIATLPHDLVFVQDHNLVFCSFCMIVKYVFSAKIYFMKTLNTIMKYKTTRVSKCKPGENYISEQQHQDNY